MIKQPEYGQEIRLKRINKMLTQKEVAKEAGISRNYLSEIEMGKKGCSINTYRKINIALGFQRACPYCYGEGVINEKI